MRLKKLLLLCAVVFLIGWFTNTIYSTTAVIQTAKPLYYGMLGLTEDTEKVSPSDWIKNDQIHVYDDRVVVDLKGASWAEFTDTNSMDPVIDKGANSIEVAPESEDAVEVGDIISYNSKITDSIIIHRVTAIGNDSEGVYFTVKGDNNPMPDTERVRFEQIVGVVVGVFY